MRHLDLVLAAYKKDHSCRQSSSVTIQDTPRGDGTVWYKFMVINGLLLAFTSASRQDKHGYWQCKRRRLLPCDLLVHDELR